VVRPHREIIGHLREGDLLTRLEIAIFHLPQGKGVRSAAKVQSEIRKGEERNSERHRQRGRHQVGVRFRQLLRDMANACPRQKGGLISNKH